MVELGKGIFLKVDILRNVRGLFVMSVIVIVINYRDFFLRSGEAWV